MQNFHVNKHRPDCGLKSEPNKICASEFGRKFIKSALLVGYYYCYAQREETPAPAGRGIPWPRRCATRSPARTATPPPGTAPSTAPATTWRTRCWGPPTPRWTGCCGPATPTASGSPSAGPHSNSGRRPRQTGLSKEGGALAGFISADPGVIMEEEEEGDTIMAEGQVIIIITTTAAAAAAAAAALPQKKTV